MKLIILVGLISVPAFAYDHPISESGQRYTDGRQIREEKRQEERHQEQQRMEDRKPSSTAIGGARSGQLEIEKNQDEQMRHDAEKQKFLYQYDGHYRRGL